jgi:hypothetical protein
MNFAPHRNTALRGATHHTASQRYTPPRITPLRSATRHNTSLRYSSQRSVFRMKENDQTQTI